MTTPARAEGERSIAVAKPEERMAHRYIRNMKKHWMLYLMILPGIAFWKRYRVSGL